MTSPARRGRPKLTPEEAWASALRRVEMRIDRRIPLKDGTECMLYKGPWNIEIALEPRRIVSARRVVGQALGYDIDGRTHKLVTTCHQRRCVSPDHVSQVPLDTITSGPTAAQPKNNMSTFKASLERMASHVEKPKPPIDPA